MKLNRLIIATTCVGALAACGTPNPSPTSSRPEAPASQQLQLKLRSGVYRCELGRTVDVQRDPRDAARIQVGWGGNRYGMQRFDSFSGLPRFEDRANGLVWIDLPWKGVLLDSASGQPLASECKLS